MREGGGGFVSCHVFFFINHRWSTSPFWMKKNTNTHGSKKSKNLVASKLQEIFLKYNNIGTCWSASRSESFPERPKRSMSWTWDFRQTAVGGSLLWDWRKWRFQYVLHWNSGMTYRSRQCVRWLDCFSTRSYTCTAVFTPPGCVCISESNVSDRVRK